MRYPDGDLFVSAVKGRVVARFGSGTSTAKAQQIGVYPVVEEQKDGTRVFVGLRWDEDEIVRIPREEYLSHLKAYDGVFAESELRVRTKDEFEAWLTKQAADSKAEVEKRVADEAKKAADAAKAETVETKSEPAKTAGKK